MCNRILVIGSYLTLSLLEALPERFEVSKTRLSEPLCLAAYGASKVGLGLLRPGRKMGCLTEGIAIVLLRIGGTRTDIMLF